MRKAFQLLLLLVFFIAAGSTPPVSGLGPEPGDVYREYTKTLKIDDNWRITDPKSTAAGAKEFLPNPELKIQIEDLEGALRAELVIDRWGGHPGTKDKRVRFNGNDWIKVPELTTAQYPISKVFQDNPIIEIPLAHLQEGTNIFKGTCSMTSQWWGQWGWYGIILRVYFDESKPHPTGRVTSPVDGESIGEYPVITAETYADSGISRVDFLGYYESYDVDGDGIYTDWQRYYSQTKLTRHVGSAAEEPYRVEWNTRWVPDQEPGAVKIQARIKDNNGYWYVTRAVEGISLVRDTASVRLYKAYKVPSSFTARAGKKLYCLVDIPETEPFGLIQEVGVHLRTWNGLGQNFQLNDRYAGSVHGTNHFFSYAVSVISPDLLTQGQNKISFQNDTEHHGCEVLWPGPGITIRYEVFRPEDATCDFDGDGSIGVEDLISLLLLGHRYPHDPRLDWNFDGRYEINDAIALLKDIVQGTCPNQGAQMAAATNSIGGHVLSESLSDGEIEYLEKTLARLPLSPEQERLLKEALQSLKVEVPGPQGTAALKQNAPNPFNPVTSIVFSLPQGTPVKVKLAVYDLRGRKLVTLVDDQRVPGEHTVFWDGRDGRGNELPNGVYLYRLEAGDRVLTRKMVLLK